MLKDFILILIGKLNHLSILLAFNVEIGGSLRNKTTNVCRPQIFNCKGYDMLLAFLIDVKIDGATWNNKIGMFANSSLLNDVFSFKIFFIAGIGA